MNYIKKLSGPNYKYPLLPAHKFAIGILLFFSFVFIIHPQHYIYIGEPSGIAEISFLQAGDYTIDYKLAFASADNVLMIYSENTLDSENHFGVTIAQQDISTDAVEGQLSFHLDKDIHNITITTYTEHCLEYIKLQSVQLLCTDNYLMALLCFVLAVIVFALGHYADPQKYKIPVFLVCLGLLASFPLANGLLSEGHDTAFHLARLESIYQGLRAGEFPVRIGSAQKAGFGSLSATMYPQLFLYPFALLRFAGISLMLCYKLLTVSINIGCSLITYYAVKNICHSEKTGILVSILYTFSLYRLTNVYLRSALGENLAMTFIPLVLWGIYEVLWGNDKKWPLLALGMSAVLQSHVLSVEMYALFLVPAVILRCLSKPYKNLGGAYFFRYKSHGCHYFAERLFPCSVFVFLP